MPSIHKRPEIIVIAAFTVKERLMGNGYVLPWPSLREDLRRFKKMTFGHVLIMGRRTFKGVILQFGKPLPGRRILVLTSRGPLPDYPSIETFTSLTKALEAMQDVPKVFIGGGVRPYEEALPMADRLEFTLVEGNYEGDAHFPPYKHIVDRHFELIDRQPGKGLTFESYRRRAS